MKVKLSVSFRFEASHKLSHLAPSHPCHNLHGHSYEAEVEVTGKVNPETGFLLDYADIRALLKPIISQLDHTHLNDVPGLEMPTTELIAQWLWQRIKVKLPVISKITIRETPFTCCEYWGE